MAWQLWVFSSVLAKCKFKFPAKIIIELPGRLDGRIINPFTVLRLSDRTINEVPIALQEKTLPSHAVVVFRIRTSLHPGGYTIVTRSLEAPAPRDVDALVAISGSSRSHCTFTSRPLSCHFIFLFKFSLFLLVFFSSFVRHSERSLANFRG